MHDETRMPTRAKRLAAMGSIAALLMGSLALAGCGNDDDLPPMEQEAPMEEPAQQPPMGDDPAMDDDPAMGDDTMADPMESQEPMPAEDEWDDDEEPGGF